jgi:hypothetical protein
MTFEVGKTYECRDGHYTTIIERMDAYFPIIKGDDTEWRYESSGSKYLFPSNSWPDRNDLIREVMVNGPSTPIKKNTGPLKIK